MRLHQLAMAGAVCLALNSAALAADKSVPLPYRSGVEIEYSVLPDDSVASIREQLLRTDIRWIHVTQLNGLPADASIRPGQVLRIPVTWLRYGPKYATVDSVSGQVSVNGQPADKNSKLTENDRIVTEEDGTVIIVLPDGTEMQIAPGSTVRIERLRQYFDGESVDARLRLERGQIVSDSPELSQRQRDKRDIRIQTPKATAAVRGTHFRVSDATDVSASSVLSGEVNWKASRADVSLPKGFGASANASGDVTLPEVLLEAPSITVPGQPLTVASTQVRFSPIAGATAYRVRIAANTEFSNDLSEQVVTEPRVQLDSRRDGNHFIAVRGISENGVDGLDGIGKLTFLARPLAPGLTEPADEQSRLADRATLNWQPRESATAYRVQVANDPGFDSLLVDVQTQAPTYTFERSTSPGEPIRLHWRVAAVDGWTVGPYTEARSFVLETLGPTPAATEEDDGVLIQWPTVPGASYTVQLVDQDAVSADAVTRVETDQNRTRFDGLPAGRYSVRVVARFAGSGLASRAGDPAQFVVRRSWTNRFGDPVDTSDGSLQISQ